MLAPKQRVACAAFILVFLTSVAQTQTSLPTLLPDTELEAYDQCEYTVCSWQPMAFDGRTALTEVDFGRIAVTQRDDTGQWPLQTLIESPDIGWPGIPIGWLGRPAAIQGDILFARGSSAYYRNRDVVYVMQRSSAGWTKRQVLAPQHSAAFDDADIVDIALDGGLALVSVIHHRTAADGSRDAHAQIDVYVRQPSGLFSWRAIIDPKTWMPVPDYVGYRVALSGNVALIGDPTALSWTGRAHLYQRTSAGWVKRKTFAPIAATTDNIRFGNAVSLDTDALAISAPRQSDVPNHPGAVYVYARSGATWQDQPQILSAPELNPTPPSDPRMGWNFGQFIAIEGERLVASIDAFNVDGPQPPLGYLFERRASSWTPVASFRSELIHPASVFLSGSTLLLGTTEFDRFPLNVGHIYRLPPVGTLP